MSVDSYTVMTEHIDANTFYRRSKVETEQLSYTVRNFTYLIGQRMSMGKICTFTSLNIADTAETAGT